MFKKDDWITDQLDRPAFELSANDLDESTFEINWNQFKGEHQNERFLVFSRIKTDAVSKWQCLERAGFKLIDTNVQFELNGSVAVDTKYKNEFVICFAKKKHQKAVGLIARENVLYSRFHIDPEINNNLAKQMKQIWAENFFVGLRGDKMVLALVDRNPVGFLQLILRGDSLLVDFIVVKKEVHGLGIASAMVGFASQNIEHSRICVGSQIGNVPSLRLWHKLGFFVASAAYVFHYHN